MRTASLLASVPLLGVFVLMAVSLVRALRADGDAAVTSAGQPRRSIRA
jgi:choline-glycine betaine transporter